MSDQPPAAENDARPDCNWTKCVRAKRADNKCFHWCKCQCHNITTQKLLGDTMITSHVVYNVQQDALHSFSHIDAGAALTLLDLGIIRETKHEVVAMGDGMACVYYYVRGDK